LERDNEDRSEAAVTIKRCVDRLLAADPSSEQASLAIWVLLGALGRLARETINRDFPATESVDQIEGRSNWLSAIYMLSEINLFPGMPGLMLALSELNRGRQLESVAPLIAKKGSGSRTPYQRLAHMKRAIEAGARITALSSKSEERDAYLRACGTTYWSLERYRQVCSEAAPRFWPRENALATVDVVHAQLLLKVEIDAIKAAEPSAKAD
jgi:hypothetical protein